MDKFSCSFLKITKILGLQDSYGNVIPDLGRRVLLLVWHSLSLIVEELCSFLWATLSTFAKSISEITNSMRSHEFIYVRLGSPATWTSVLAEVGKLRDFSSFWNTILDYNQNLWRKTDYHGKSNISKQNFISFRREKERNLHIENVNIFIYRIL